LQASVDAQHVPLKYPSGSSPHRGLDFNWLWGLPVRVPNQWAALEQQRTPVADKRFHFWPWCNSVACTKRTFGDREGGVPLWHVHSGPPVRVSFPERKWHPSMYEWQTISLTPSPYATTARVYPGKARRCTDDEFGFHWSTMVKGAFCVQSHLQSISHHRSLYLGGCATYCEAKLSLPIW